VPKDSAEAVKWYRKAAEHGSAVAQSNLGLMYANGIGVIKNPAQAHAWFNVAGSNGNEDAKKNFAIIEKQISSAKKA